MVQRIETAVGSADGSIVTVAVPPPATARRRGISRVLGRRRSEGLSITAWVALVWLILATLLAVFAPLLPLEQPDDIVGESLRRPGLRFDEPLGTDHLGRSLLSRVVYGSRISMAVGVGGSALGMVLGGAIGLVAGYRRRLFDVATNAFSAGLLAFPPLVLLLALSATMGATLPTLVVSLTLLSLPTFVRLTRANTIAISNAEFVLAARVTGARPLRIMTREILPVVVRPLLAYGLLMFATMIVAEGSLSFLGLGIPPPTPSWGGMISAGKSRLATDPHLTFVPAMALFVTVFAINIVGDQARRRLEFRRSVL